MAKVLVVDDHPLNRELIVTLLGYDGHEAIEAGDGAEALSIAKAQHPDLVICDILMPTMDGYEFVRRLRADPSIADTEVMFYTANYHEREAQNLANILGVSRILVKPCPVEEIMGAIDQALTGGHKPAPQPASSEFDNEHLRVLTNKLAAKAEELEHANQRLAALTELNLQLSAERDLRALLDKACQGARELTGARYAILSIEGRSNGRSLVFLGYGLSPEETDRLHECAFDHGVIGRMLRERRPVRFTNPGGNPAGIGLPGDFPAVHCGVAAPIASALSVFGWVCLINKVGAPEFTEQDEWVSGAHAAQAGRIYENWQLYGQLERRADDLAREVAMRQRTEQQLHRVLRARKVLAECNRSLVRATDENHLLAELCRFLIELGGYGAAWVGLARKDAARTIETVAHAGDDASFLDTVRFSWADDDFGQGPAGVAVRTRMPQIVHDIATDPRLVRWRQAALERGFNAAAALPLKYEANTFGVLCIVAAETDAFDADEVELLVELTDDVAFGMHALRARVLQQQMEETLRLRNRAIDESINAIVISEANLDADNPTIYVNPAFTTMTGYRADEVLGRNPRFLMGDDWDQPDIQRLRDAVREGADARVLLRNYRKDGTLFWNEISLASMHDPSGKVSHFIAIFNDLTDRRRYEAELELQANHDALTGLANRNLLNDRLQQTMIHAKRNGSSVAVMLLDLDRFKVINDSLGHAAGDTLLQEVARRLISSVRQGDTVARLGGDEFMIVMPELGAESDAVMLASKLLETICAPMMLAGRSMVVTCSLGVSLYPRDGPCAANLLKNADVAMYRAKEIGRNRFQFYAPEMNMRTLQRLEIENGLRRALERKELELYFQPKIELVGGSVVGAEALIRWRHPELGMVSPGEFIPVAEETGLIVPIGEWVIGAACEQLKAWREEGLGDVSLAVNVSARQFQQEELLAVLEDALRASDIPARQLLLEVTESAVMDNPEKTIVTLGELRKLGVRTSLDDFGTGYSSLNYLKRFPIDSLKIDQSFVADLTTSAEDAAIALMVISLAHSLKQTVIAEGVETEAQLEFLRRHGCDEMQGYLFSRPLPAAAFAQLLRDGTGLSLAPLKADRTFH
ncbi:EAL domain-containing protein [Azoarcus sp. KH32C]|uniref:EAL domain-containing protein n=1 Tax=Azoarcus sp. KH32C TaxID=748247 RepID=UPI0002385ED8|nr:EAL domain-containing protein [Azoarcus sp. KH32C]BAL24504.1 putative signaling protein [Azoarcus sp. KH32C]